MFQENVAKWHLRQQLREWDSDSAQHLFPAPDSGSDGNLCPGRFQTRPIGDMQPTHWAQLRDPRHDSTGTGLPGHHCLPSWLQRDRYQPLSRTLWDWAAGLLSTTPVWSCCCLHCSPLVHSLLTSLKSLQDANTAWKNATRDRKRSRNLGFFALLYVRGRPPPLKWGLYYCRHQRYTKAPRMAPPAHIYHYTLRENVQCLTPSETFHLRENVLKRQCSQLLDDT